MLPLCLSSYRASFVNSYSSVQVRPGAPSGLWCNNNISPCEGDGPGANPGFLTSHSLSGLSCCLSFNRMPQDESDHALLDGLGCSELCTVALKTGSCISDLGECCSGRRRFGNHCGMGHSTLESPPQLVERISPR